MSWQLGSLIVVCGALAAGFAWYERSRPPSKLVATVAALAALAVAGRVTFDLVPNVQPTTDITLLTGYTLGAGPGFLVGAIAALASNVFLGQGPWTPWEMLGWAAIGLFGAGLARVTRRRLSRLPLSVACGFAGLMYGAWMDVFQTVTFAADRSGDSYLAVALASLPFNVAHAVGNFVLCMLFGPAFVRTLERFKTRLEVRWVAAPVATLALIVLGLLATSVPALAARGPAGASAYLRSAQNSDGGFGAAPGQSSSQLMTGWTALGLEAAGRNPLDLRHGGKSPIDYMKSKVGQLNDAAELSRTVLVVRGAGLSARRFAGHDLLAELERAQDGNGSFRRQAPTTAFAVMALRGAGRKPGSASVRRATEWLLAQQNPDGGFSNGDRGGTSDVDDTGAVLQGLAAGGKQESKAVSRAVTFVRGAQGADGGMGQFANAESNAQSSAWAAQGLTAVGRSPARIRRNGKSLIGYLASLQQANGSYRYSRTSAQTPVWVTGQVLAAVSGATYPLDPVARKRHVRSAEAATVADSAPKSARQRGSDKAGRARTAGTASAAAAASGARAPEAVAATTLPVRVRDQGPASTVRDADGGGIDSRLIGIAIATAVLGAGAWALRRYSARQ